MAGELTVNDVTDVESWADFGLKIAAAGAGYWVTDIANGLARPFTAQLGAIPVAGGVLANLAAPVAFTIGTAYLADKVPGGFSDLADAFALGAGVNAGVNLIRNLSGLVGGVAAAVQPVAAQMARAPVAQYPRTISPMSRAPLIASIVA